MNGMDNKILLSICIPTYNGATSFLDTVLNNLIPYIQKYEGLVEVIVSDNCSSDSTFDILKKYDQYAYYRYYRNNQNIGFNGNMLKLADELANGEYCWINGDDDILNTCFLDFIIKHLFSSQFDYISLQYQITTQTRYSFEMNNHQIDYSIKESSFVHSIDSNCLRGNTLGTFMSSAIWRTRIFRGLSKHLFENKFDKYYNIFPNAYLMATGYHDKKCAIVKEPVLFVFDRDKNWATSDNMYMIVSSALVDMYNYFLSLGMKKKDLRLSRRRMVYDNLKMGLFRLSKGKRVNTNFLFFFVESLKYPYIHYLLFGNILRILVGKKNIDIG